MGIEVKTPFDVISCAQSKIPFDQQIDNVYNQFLINRHLSYFPDMIDLVLELSRYQITNNLHYEAISSVIGRKKRFVKWGKADKVTAENIELVCDKYVCNQEVAKQYLKILTLDDIKQLKNNAFGGKA